MTYEGWKNRETWNVALWFNNDYGLYQEKLRFFRRKPILSAFAVGEFCRETLPYGKTPDMESQEEMKKVIWDEIRENWQEEIADIERNTYALRRLLWQLSHRGPNHD